MRAPSSGESPKEPKESNSLLLLAEDERKTFNTIAKKRSHLDDRRENPTFKQRIEVASGKESKA